ncbi:MAG: hypothetical protein PHQ58_10785 [Rhodoferax sp.]|uniref:hypothetical protein n=1 Tax=Rhodoferax sp. TaxID=50421 RepID=UPI002639EFC4|nr:hypothetical protein [Rhodoferax sp.]MDD2880917.1 hypothetical protein [Rhodoferax sp.]
MQFFQLITTKTLKWLLVASFFSLGLAMAQTEPTLNQVYATAQSGKLDQAQLMIQQVLVSHPNSAKAFFVQSELYARQANLAKARDALATAEKLAPGLPFAKAASVQSLRAQLAGKSGQVMVSGSSTHVAALSPGDGAFPAVAAASPSSWLLPLLLAVGVIGLGYVLFRKKQPEPFAQQSGFANPNGLNGPQTFGSAVSATPYAPAGYPAQGGMSSPQTFGLGSNASAMQAPAGQATGNGLGGRIMGGVATGLAVGAGVMAAQAIGRNLMGSHTPEAAAATNPANQNFQALDQNPDMGGADFGISDTSSWDSGDVGGSSDWDN